MMLPLVVVGCTSKQSVSQCIEATTATGVDNATSPIQQTPLNRIISPSEADHYAKTTGRSQYINEQLPDRVALSMVALMQY